GHSIVRRGVERGLLEVRLVDVRDHGLGRHRQVDDVPFGGGPGMVMRADVLARALDEGVPDHGEGWVILLSPQGERFDQEMAKRLARKSHLILVCGHYEGIDERFVQAKCNQEVSLGDFVLTGGEIPAMAIIDAVARLQPGVLGDSASFESDSFQEGMLDHPHYTRPATWREKPQGLPKAEADGGEKEWSVPEVLLSGHHGEVAAWRRRQALLRTLLRRPEWLPGAGLTRAEKVLIERLATELAAMEESGE
ncbi:MAG: tRNA (guanosine(37)-N1)-methyltransferase TrmD, partial [Magnetococcales bacterium]|nr:tRNA (guanosine(37)-N1)-methyltransferase TrmD [Magnetococcales bacterium]